MITNIELTDDGTAAFNAWLDATAKPGTRREAVAFELLDVLADRVASGESLVYELRGQHTISGQPETLTLSAADITVTEEDEG